MSLFLQYAWRGKGGSWRFELSRLIQESENYELNFFVKLILMRLLLLYADNYV
jgi:hypothetical protein